MHLLGALKRLWRHAAFRRLLTLRILSQAADGTLQVGMASYILFSPQSQPNAWAIAGVLALTLLPFTMLGPFVSPLLDTWSRRNVALYSDLTRAALAALIGVVIATGLTDGAWAVVLFGALLVAMSINRFMLAGLSAGLQHTVEADEYLTASSIVPTVGPLGVVIGAVLGFVARFSLGDVLGANRADAVVFGLSAVMFIGSVLVCLGFPRDALGPTLGEPTPGDLAAGRDRGGRDAAGVSTPLAELAGSTSGEGLAGSTDGGGVLAGLADAGRHLRTRPVAVLGLGLMAVTRLLFGLLSVAVILAARHLWHPADRPEAALADLTVWGLATGAGFILSAPVVPILVRRWGLRRSAIGLLILGAATSVVVALSTSKPVIFAASFFIGIAVQSFKICVDTIVQAHVDEQYKGRVFTFYDMLFNGAFVTAGVVAAFVLPLSGLSGAAFLGVAVTYLACAVIFAAAAARLGPAVLEKGTEDLTRAS